MQGQRFKIKTPTVAVERPGDETTLLQVPIDAAITILGEPTEGNGLIRVDWNGRIVMMFTRDLFERGEQIAE